MAKKDSTKPPKQSESMPETDAESKQDSKLEGKTISFHQIRKKNNIKKAGDMVIYILRRSLICLLLFIVFVIIYQNRYDPSYEGFVSWIKDRTAMNGQGQGFPVNVKGNQSNCLKGFNDAVVSLTDTSVTLYNASGKQVAEKQHGYSKPVLETGDRYSILYDMGSKSYRIESISSIIYTGKTENRITLADIGETGEYAISELSGENEITITLYGKYGTEKLQRTTHEYKPTDLSVIPDGSGVASVGIKAGSGEIVSVLEVFAGDKKDGAKELYRFEEAGNMYLSVEFLTNDIIMVIGDTSLSVIDIGKKEKTDYTYSGRSISSFSVTHSVGAVVMLSDYKDRKECSMLVFGKNGLKVSETQTGKQANMVCRDAKYICFAGDNKVYKYKTNGEFVAEASLDTDVTGICVIDGKIYVSGSSTIQKIEI